MRRACCDFEGISGLIISGNAQLLVEDVALLLRLSFSSANQLVLTMIVFCVFSKRMRKPTIGMCGGDRFVDQCNRVRYDGGELTINFRLVVIQIQRAEIYCRT
jgi:hypothetical protein